VAARERFVLDTCPATRLPDWGIALTIVKLNHHLQLVAQAAEGLQSNNVEPILGKVHDVRPARAPQQQELRARG